ncbi:MAG TPA: hypothetical protein VHW95_00015 [Steroidobacteraceae bacterium]|jgi:hypothetical protein|nr:hypothetical protein [Steroidobacteraceae bacterium]
MSDINVKLGEKEFKIGPLTIRQQRDLRVSDATVPKDDGAGGWTNIYDLCIKTIAIAIREDHPGMSEEDLWKLQTSEEQIAEARSQILVHAGFRTPDHPTIAEPRATVAAEQLPNRELI